MNRKTTKSSGVSLTPETVQKRADILENNLFGLASKQKDPAVAKIAIKRENWPDPVILKALDQLFPRFNINDRSILAQIGTVLSTDIPVKNPEVQAFFVLNLFKPDQQKRKIETAVTNDMLEIEILGIPLQDSRDGRIEAYFFNHKNLPGKVLKHDAIDFREINRFPSVKAGKDLLLVNYEVHGSPGLTYDGIEIPISEATPFELVLHEGVERIEQLSDRGEPTGYMVRSRKTGVVVFNVSTKVSEIDVRDEIAVDQLDYSVGNIGTEFVCPIKLKAGVICDGFKISVEGRVEVEFLNGGCVTTSDEAVIEKIQANSLVHADINIQSLTAINSTLESPMGSIFIKNELVDCKLTSQKLIFKSTKGLFTNNRLEVEQLSAVNIYICGENIIHLGTSFFVKKDQMLEEKMKHFAKKSELGDVVTGINERLRKELTNIAKYAQGRPDLKKAFKLLVQIVHSQSLENAGKVMDAMQRHISPNLFIQTRKLLVSLGKILKSIQAIDTRTIEIDADLTAIDAKLNTLSFSIQGLIRPSATLSIYCGTRESDGEMEPVLFLDSDPDGDKPVKIKGSYNLKDGFRAVGL